MSVKILWFDIHLLLLCLIAWQFNLMDDVVAAYSSKYNLSQTVLESYKSKNFSKGFIKLKVYISRN